MRVGISVSVLCLIFVFAVSPLRAQYVEIYRLDNISKELPEQDVLAKLATHFGISADTLKEEKAEYKASIGELYMAHQLAKLTSSDSKSIMTEFKSGKAWGVLAKEKKVKLDLISKDERQLEEALKKPQRASR